MNIFNEEIPFDDILSAYYDARKHKRYKIDQLEFEIDLYTNLYELWLDLNSGNYKPSTSKCFIVLKPKPREIMAAHFRDRVVHHWIVNKLLPLFEEYFIDNTFSCRLGKGNLYGVEKLKSSMVNTADDYIAKFDIESFFMSINKSLLANKLVDFINSQYVGLNKGALIYYTNMVILHCPQNDCIILNNELRYLVPESKSLLYCDKNHGLPIGNLTSQLTANFYFTIFDKILDYIFGNNYGRYVDDFYIKSNKETILSVVPIIEDILKVYDLKLHSSKRYLQPIHHGCTFLGYVVYPDRLYIINRTVNNIRLLINNYHKDYITKTEFIRSVNSTLGALVHANTYNIRKSLLSSTSINTNKSYTKLILN